MGRRNRRNSIQEDIKTDDQLFKEFAHDEETRVAKLYGPRNKDLKLKNIKPLTHHQQVAFDEYYAGYNLILHGAAGTGKTFLAFYLALQEVLERKYEKIILVRSVVPTREIGFLPGTLDEKIQVYKLPYVDICRKLFDEEEAYSRLEKREVIEFITTSFIRGFTFDNSIVIVDECSNLNFHECDSIITRLGTNSKIIFSGDYMQSDLIGKEKDGLLRFMDIISDIDSFRHIEFDKQDIVRSQLVKDYIIARDKL